MFESLGEAVLEYSQPILDINQRTELINRVESGGCYKSVALSASVSIDALIKWHKIYKKFGIDGLKLIKRGRPPMTKTKKEVTDKNPKDMSKQELIKALELVTIENEYLKKLSALVQKRKAQQHKKK